MSYIGIGTNKPNHSLEIEGNMLVSNIELGTTNQGVPFEIYSNYSNKSFLTNSRQLRLRSTPRFTPDDTSHIDMGINNVTGNTFIISEPVFNTVISGNRTFEIDNQGSTTLSLNNINATNITTDMLKITNGLDTPNIDNYFQVLDKNNAKKNIKIVKLSSLHYSTLILSDEGAVYGAGNNINGKLGLGYESSVEPVFKACVGKASSNVTHISCGFFHTMIIRDDSSLWATGNNEFYQHGNGSTISTSSFTSVTDNVMQVEASDVYTVILKNDGSVWGAGDNSRSQLGLGATSQFVTTFTKALGAGSGGVVQVSPTWMQLNYDNRHVMIVKDDGSVWGSGDNEYDQLGIDGYDQFKRTFTRALETGDIPVSNAISVSAAPTQSIILKDDSTVFGTRIGSSGYNVFNSVTNDVKQILAGNQITLILKNDGSVWGVGTNYYGQLGLGTNLYADTFTQATSNVTEIAATYAPDDRESYSIVFKDDGKIYGTGSNFQGQFGIGTPQLTQTTTTFTELKYVQNISIETSNIISFKSLNLYNNEYLSQPPNGGYQYKNILAISDGLVSMKYNTTSEGLIGQDQGIMKLGVAVATQSSNTFVTINGSGTVSATSYIPFTGKHKGYISEIPEKGMIVSVIHSNYQNINNVDTWVKESSIHKDPNVFGVSDGEKLFNAIGEGAIWVCDANGPLTSGDYIVSSTLTGYGIRQDGTRKANYTVAKILQDCIFEDDNTRYLSMSEENSLSTISREQYLTDTGNVYKASFVGCTYHCG